MHQAPYNTARRVFWIMDNCSAHRGQQAADRFRSKWPNAILVHTPIHASWLNQIEIYFSTVQSKVLTPNDFGSLAERQRRLLAFQTHYQRCASPFQWTFTRKTLQTLLAKIDRKPLVLVAKPQTSEYVTVIPNQSTKRGIELVKRTKQTRQRLQQLLESGRMIHIVRTRRLA